MPIPALPVAHLVVIQSAFAFSRLKGLLDQPALAGHSDQGFNRVFTAGASTDYVLPGGTLGGLIVPPFLGGPSAS
jgi:hypothetical protein